MSLHRNTKSVGTAPRSAGYVRHLGTLALACLFLFVTSSADAQRRRNKRKRKKPVATVKEVKRKAGAKNQVFDFTGLSLGGSVRTPQLLYFLDRASEELQRASLKRRSFVPEMVRSISEEGL